MFSPRLMTITTFILLYVCILLHFKQKLRLLIYFELRFFVIIFYLHIKLNGLHL